MVHLKQAFGKSVVPILAFVCLLLAASACGGEDEKAPQPYKGDDIESTVKKKRKVKKGAAEFAAKPEWDAVSPHFLKYVKVIEKEVHSKSVTWNYKDAFADHIEKFYPTPVEARPIIDLGKAAEKKAEKKKEEPTIKSILAGITAPGGADGSLEEDELAMATVTPLIKHAVMKYNFRIIMTGVSNPEVVVEDPEGGIHVVHVNDKIGLEGGYVSDILKHKVYIKMPDQPEPMSVSLAPESLPDSFAKN